jgi:DNA-binding winged helix-turn-helix (wHTH) protein/Tol biopolymer transport system component
MAQQFWVNNYFIDVTRNQIQHQKQTIQLPPKALKVLEVLAAQAGEVVSHDELMDLVWEKSVVGPNTLQRAIAQLRKAFGDDSKQQAFIKTHAKQGYSLEANVRWEGGKVTNNETPLLATVIQATSKPAVNYRYGLYVIAILVVSVALFTFLRQPPPLYNQLTPITASDSQEYNASYSPDGKYLVFNRYEGQCVSHLWAKDLNNKQEVRLSHEPGHYSSLSWSADGSQLAFVLQSDCEAEVNLMQRCWQLQTLDFARAWNGETDSTIRFDCDQIQTSHPRWLNDGRIALLQYPSPEIAGPDVVIHDARTGIISKVPLEHSGKIYSLVYSRVKNLLASVTLDDNNQHVLRTFKVDGEIQSAASIKRLPHHSVYGYLPISFSPDGESFLASPKGQIHSLSLTGELSLIQSDNISGLSDPIYHPDQTKIAATQGTKDFDIGLLNSSQDNAAIDVIARSTETDINAQFQPQGELIAFSSYRSGQSQLWLIDGERTYQLTQFEGGMDGLLYSWSPDGQQLVVNHNNQLAIAELDGSYQIINTPMAINYLVPWTHPTKLLAIANQSGNDQLFSIDLESGETTNTGLEDVMWAAYTKEKHIVYSDNQKRFYLISNGEKTALSAIDTKLYGKRALLANEQIYGIDGQHQLWQYDLQNGAFTVLTKTNKDVIYVSSLKGEQMLATQFIGGRRELVELEAR